MRALEITVEHFPIAGSFTISRGTKTAAAVVTCRLREGAHAGHGECVPYARYGETIEGVVAAIEAARPAIEAGIGRVALMEIMPPGAARNAVDCALWDLEAKARATPVWQLADLALPQPLTTAYTISLSDPETMAARAAEAAHRPVLKVKVGTPDDRDRIRAVRRAAPDAVIILDGNEGWSEETLGFHLAVCAEEAIALVEQPLPAGRDGLLSTIDRLVPICADESVHTIDDLESLAGRYDAVNIKLDKTGGLTHALEMRDRARALGLDVMVGCMVGTSLAMAPAALLAQGAAYVDLDGPLLLSRDRDPALTYEGSVLLPLAPALWG
jgi:L-alanine-DL-glutamate epimerase-like enolase superfamily enzyme